MMKKEKWVISAKKADFQQIGQKFSIDPVIARIIRNRDVVGDEAMEQYLYGGIETMYNPLLLKGMEQAVEIILDKIHQQKKIRIIGDYDIDGISATCILHKGLMHFGAVVDYDIPDRVLDGYGLNLSLLHKAYEDGVDTVLTCDNGIAANEAISKAKALGMTVVVTDHHEVRFTEQDGQTIELLPEADAIVNPKQSGCLYPFKGLCGAMVAYKLIDAMSRCREETEEERTMYLYPLLEFGAIATIGDVMELQNENRVVVKSGLQRLRKTNNEGIRSLVRANGIELNALSAYHVGFVIGPCLNATGRLDTAKRAIRMLLSEDRGEAALIAAELVELNDTRKKLTEKGIQEAVEYLESSAHNDDAVLVVFLPDCHESVAGIIAGRIREYYGKPTIVLTRAHAGVKGSGRSIDGYSMFEKLQECASLLQKFGGHPLAAGLSLEECNIEPLRQALNARAGLTEDDFTEKVRIDLQMPFYYIGEGLIEQLAVLEPFGKGNEKPLFAEREVRVLQKRLLGRNHNVLSLVLEGPDGTRMDAVCFQNAEEQFKAIEIDCVIRITYYPQINEYQGRRKLQLVVQNMQRM